MKPLERLGQEQFDVIVSDMGRPESPRAGYSLLEQVRSADDRTPFVIYAGSSAPARRQEALARGAQGTTNRPIELFALVTDALHESR
jgi:CheY-like chemotaxis protein